MPRRWYRPQGYRGGLRHALHRQIRGPAGGAAHGQRLYAVDISMTTRELARMIQRAGILFDHLPRGSSTHAGREHRRLRDFRRVRRRDGGRPAYRGGRWSPGRDEASGVPRGPRYGWHQEAVYDCPAGRSGLRGLRPPQRQNSAGRPQVRLDYDFIEFMACPGGCINGGGQPLQTAEVRSFTDIRALRAAALYRQDETMPIRKEP